MDFDTYRVKGKETVDYIADYLENIRSRRVFPDVIPGYMRELLPKEAPQKGENWDDIFKDVERVIMPGITHWQSPHMHAYFPALNSFPSLLGDMISDAINCIGFTWAASPAATELEAIVMDWLVKALGLPEKFLISNQEPYGGGVLQTSVSESTYYSLLAARTRMFNKFGVGEVNKYIEKSEINGRLVCYCSDQAHSSVEKSALVAITRIHILPTDDKLSLRGETLRKAIEKDKKEGLIPFFVCATLGTTGACAFDNVEEIGPICKQEDIWLHIDAAYAGSAFLCPEYRKFLKGIEYASSFVFNPSKWLMTNFDCTCLWVESSIHLHQTFTVAPLYLKHKYSGDAIDYMHWQVGLSRRFRALKLWFVLRSFGIEGLQEHIRKGVKLGQLFENLVLKDDRFEILAERYLGLVVFRLKGENEITEQLLKQLNKDGRIHLVPAKVKNNYIIRFTVTSYYTTEEDIKRDWKIIQATASAILTKMHDDKMHEEHLKKFQSSLMLSNVPQTPKIVNASFLAFFTDSDFVLSLESAKKLTNLDYSQTHLPLTPRRKPRFLTNFGQKMFSLDEFSQSLPNQTKNSKNFLTVLNNQNGGKDQNSSTDSDEASNNGDVTPVEFNSNSSNGCNNVRKNSKFNKQTSLDSKIEHIFEEAANNTNNAPIDNNDLN